MCINSPTVAKPSAAQTSGASNMKYSGNFDTFSAASVTANPTSSFTITKSARSSNILLGDLIIYKVTVKDTTVPCGSNWRDIANNLFTYHFMNVLNNQLYRSVGNNGTSCADAYSSNLAITVLQSVLCVEICHGGIDNDGDGWIDCADSACKPVSSVLGRRL